MGVLRSTNGHGASDSSIVPVKLGSTRRPRHRIEVMDHVP